MSSKSIFEIIQAGEIKSTERFPTFYFKEKDVSRVVREIRESIPSNRNGDPVTCMDIESPLRQGRIRIGKTTLRVVS